MVELIQANISWIVLGLMFFLMMRMHGSGAGCCGGHQHSAQPRRPDRDSGVESETDSAGTGGNVGITRDPVCGMEVNPATAAATTEYKGQSYYFCAAGCKAAFEKNPEKFLQGQDAGHQHRMLSGG